MNAPHVNPKVAPLDTPEDIYGWWLTMLVWSTATSDKGAKLSFPSTCNHSQDTWMASLQCESAHDFSVCSIQPEIVNQIIRKKLDLSDIKHFFFNSQISLQFFCSPSCHRIYTWQPWTFLLCVSSHVSSGICKESGILCEISSQRPYSKIYL